MDLKYTPISLLSFKNLLEKHFIDFQSLRVWGTQTPLKTISRDSNLPFALAFNEWPRIKISFNKTIEINDDNLLCKMKIGGKVYIASLEHLDVLQRELTFSSKIYRSEARDEERLVCYPHRTVYAYTTCPKLHENNVLMFQPKNLEESNRLRELRDKFIKRSEKLEEGDLLGLRVFDLSSNGMSIVVSKEELDVLDNFLDEMSFKLNFMGDFFNIMNLKKVHSTHLIVPGIRDSKLFKVGISFDFNQSISEKTQELIDSSISLEELEKDHLV